MESVNYCSEDDVTRAPNPADFDKFLPWACGHLGMEFTVSITRVMQHEYVSTSSQSERSKSRVKLKPKPSTVALSSDLEKAYAICPFESSNENAIHIHATYDGNENLVQVKFHNNKTVPRLVLKLIGLVANFHLHMTNITINSGLDQYALYEISKFLPYSHITDICLDNTYLKNPNYQILLENRNFIKHLSLSRCDIDDSIVEAISATLVYPCPSSKTLSILNLSSNRIADDGAKMLSNVLRSNRHLSYLNISDNMITDLGACYLLNTLLAFPLCISELLASKSRYISYLKEKQELANNIVKELSTGELDKRPKRKSVKTVGKKGKLDKEASLKLLPDANNLTNVETVLERAANIAENTLGEFKDPFNKMNTVIKDGVAYCIGNNVLRYLNVAYNNLTFVTVKKLLDVLIYQRDNDRKAKGLVNVSLEGNCIPEFCRELLMIDEILIDGLSSNLHRLSLPKRKNISKSSHSTHKHV